MRQFSTTCLALFALLIITPGASAKDLDGRLGLGIEQSIAGVSGLTLRYWPSARLSLRSTLGGSVASGLGEDGDEIGSSIGVSFGVIYNIARSLHANLGLGASAAIGMRSETMRDATSSDPGARSGDDLQLSLEIPIVIEYFLSEAFSVSVATGFLVAFVPSTGAVLTPKGHAGGAVPDTVGVGLGSGSITGSLGAVFYF